MEHYTGVSRSERDHHLFNAIAAKHVAKDLFGPSRVARASLLTRTLNKIRMDDHADLLEVGCGAGFSAEYLCGHYATYTGIDYSEELIKYARLRNKRMNVNFHATDLFHFTPDFRYDVILMLGVLHHMPTVPVAIRMSLPLLKPGGFLVVNEPHSANMVVQCLRYFRTKIDSSYSSEQVQFSAAELIQLFRESGLTNVRCYPQGLLSPPFAQVVIRPSFLTNPISKVACVLDEYLENHLPDFLMKISWDIIVCGEKSS